jgi:hypothetical protein
LKFTSKPECHIPSFIHSLIHSTNIHWGLFCNRVCAKCWGHKGEYHTAPALESSQFLLTPRKAQRNSSKQWDHCLELFLFKTFTRWVPLTFLGGKWNSERDLTASQDYLLHFTNGKSEFWRGEEKASKGKGTQFCPISFSPMSCEGSVFTTILHIQTLTLGFKELWESHPIHRPQSWPLNTGVTLQWGSQPADPATTQ